MNPRISVVIPTYNRADKVLKSIESVLTQTVADLEVIVVDDGSSDDTERILAQTFRDRIRYYAQANQGASVARKKGIGKRGESGLLSLTRTICGKRKARVAVQGPGPIRPRVRRVLHRRSIIYHSETRTFFEMAEENYRHEGTMGINTDVLRFLVRPGGAGMVVCLSSLLARADIMRKTGGFDPEPALQPRQRIPVPPGDEHGLLLRQPATGPI